MEDHKDIDQVQSAGLGVYQLPMVTTRDLESDQLWLGWQDSSVGLALLIHSSLLHACTCIIHVPYNNCTCTYLHVCIYMNMYIISDFFLVHT